MLKVFQGVGFAAALSVSMVAFGAEQEAVDATSLPAAVIGGATLVTAKVKAVDHQTREVTLETESGDTLTITAGPEVRNFAQIEVGDQVTAEYYEALAMVLEKGGPGISERVESESAERAEPGEKPAGTVTRTVDAVGVVKEVDREGRKIFVEGANGMVTLNVPAEIDLDTVQVGDEIRARYIETVAISVTEN